MDSLVLILGVFGVVMILAGVARMRANRKRAWSEVDHNVLFTRSGEEPAPIMPSLDEAVLQNELDELSQSIVAERSEPVIREKVNVNVDPVPVMESKPKIETKPKEIPVPKETSRSLLDRLRGERDKALEIPEAPASVYREGAPNWIIALNIVAPKGLHFTGPGVVGAVQDAGMRFGDMNIFHYKKNGASLFSMVNGVKPGNFDLKTIDSMTTPCLSLFIQVPNQNGNNLETFDTMLATARKIADKLGGDVRDEARNLLTKSAIDYLRQKIAEYDLKWQAA